jgi:hypothetical protein
MGQRDIQADPNNWLFQHEYGHYLQSQEMGLSYLFRVGLPSLMSASEHTGLHDFRRFEQDANRRAFLYFNEHVPGFYQTEEQHKANQLGGIERGWNFHKNPFDVYGKGKLSRGEYYDYNNPESRALVNGLSLRARWHDYFGSILFGLAL